jgi:hypothetical protein
VIVSDNRTEMTSRAILEWINRTGVTGITSVPLR